MAKPKQIVIDLDNCEKTNSPTTADVIIYLKTKEDGTRLPPLMYNFVNKEDEAVDVKPVDREMIDSKEGAVWSPHVAIDTKVKPEEYIYIIDWWFREASKKENAYFFERQMAKYPELDVPLAAKKIRGQLEGHHAYSHTIKKVNGKNITIYTKRIKDVGKKFLVLLEKYNNNGWYRK